jgi:hypothetical protein
MSLPQNIAVKVVAGYVVFGFVIMEVLYLGVWCRPFHQYWAVPPENSMLHLRPRNLNWGQDAETEGLVQCSAATKHLITNAALNITSDVMIILIPLPVFLRSQLPTKKKAILCTVFGLGSFTVSEDACSRPIQSKEAPHLPRSQG